MTSAEPITFVDHAAIHDFRGIAPLPWHAERDETLRCVQVRDETHDVKTFVFAAVDARHFRYVPGQFVTLELAIDGRSANRCYTLSSTPTRPDCVSITVKRMPDGIVSNWLHRHLRPGMTLAAMGPAGTFSCFLAPAPRYLFVSGGSGITPLMSMSRALHDLASDADVVFVHCARTPADIVFADELAGLARGMKRFRTAFVCEQQPAGSAYAGHLGRIDAARLAQMVPDLATRDVYTCGPAPFMAAVREGLASTGYPMARYHEESFSFETLVADTLAHPGVPPAAGADEAAPTIAPYRVVLSRMNRAFDCRADQTILQAATEAGIRLPFSCSNGICGTCKTKKLEGVVDMVHGGGIRQREIDQGFVLPCCSRPRADLVLER